MPEMSWTAGVVEHQVGLAEAVGDLIGGRPDGGAIGDVDRQRQCGTAGGLDVLDDVVQLVLAAGQHDHGGAEFGEAFGGRGAHAAGSAGDDSDTVGQGSAGEQCRHDRDFFQVEGLQKRGMEFRPGGAERTAPPRRAAGRPRRRGRCTVLLGGVRQAASSCAVAADFSRHGARSSCTCWYFTSSRSTVSRPR